MPLAIWLVLAYQHTPIAAELPKSISVLPCSSVASALPCSFTFISVYHRHGQVQLQPHRTKSLPSHQEVKPSPAPRSDRRRASRRPGPCCRRSSLSPAAQLQDSRSAAPRPSPQSREEEMRDGSSRRRGSWERSSPRRGSRERISGDADQGSERRDGLSGQGEERRRATTGSE